MKNQKILYNLETLQLIRSQLFSEMKRAAAGEKSSFPFIKYELKKRKLIDRKRLQVLVIGGSNIISAIVEKKGESINILNLNKEDLPNITNKEIFLSLIEKYVSKDTEILSLNLGYPLKVVSRNNQIDGKLIKGSKEHPFNGLINSLIGEEIEKFLFEKRSQKIIVNTVNDTTCLVLSGLSKNKAEELVGGIVGTGFNFGFFLDKGTVVNLEAGNFNKFPQTETGKIVDMNSISKGNSLFEKEISGGYLYKHYNVYAKENDLEEVSSTSELNEISYTDPESKEIIDLLFKRSASLVACQIAAIYDFKNQSKLSIIMEGSLFWKAKNYKDYVFEYLLQLGIPYGKVKIEKIEKSYILGAAYLVFR